MRFLSLLLALAATALIQATTESARQAAAAITWNIPAEEQKMDTLSGKTIRWTFVEGPTAGTKFEHEFHADGTVTWRYVEGPHQGASKTEKSYSAVKVNDRTWAISYLAASGHTLTVVLSLDDGRMVGFASNEKSWYALNGTFEGIH